MLAVYVWHTVIPRFPNLPKTSNIAVLFPKLLKRAGTKIQKGYRKSLRKVPKITLIIEFHRLKDFLFRAVKDTVQEKVCGEFYLQGCRLEGGRPLRVSVQSGRPRLA